MNIFEHIKKKLKNKKPVVKPPTTTTKVTIKERELSLNDYADYVIVKHNQLDKEAGKKLNISCKRIMRILYLAEIDYMLQNKKELIKDNFYAWESGPALPDIYRVYMKMDELRPLKDDYLRIDKNTSQCLDNVITKNYNVSTEQLNEICKDEIWQKNSPSNSAMSKRDVYEHYNSKQM